MSYTVTQENILHVEADAAVICVENAMLVSEGISNEALAAAGGEALRLALRQKRFIPVGSAIEVPPCGLPYGRLLVTSAPRWWNGECNELLVLHRCYTNLFRLAEELGCRTLVLPFLSCAYYLFPLADAVRIALFEAERTKLKVCFFAETPELFELSGKEYRKPQIVSYIGCHRDHAMFRLDNGSYVRVDIRPEKRDAEIRMFVDACYYEESPFSKPLPEEEIARLRAVYESDPV